MTPYRHADKYVKQLYEYTESIFHNMAIMPFDELNVMDAKKRTSEAFIKIDGQCRKGFHKIAERAYRDALKEMKAEHEFDNGLVVKVLKGYNPVTEYVYEREWTRKRDRLTEGLLAAVDLWAIRNVLQKSKRLTLNQIQQYGDLITDAAREQAMRDVGIHHVRWVSIDDERRCEECRDRDGQIFEIDKVPTKHRRCRCYLEAVD